LHGISGASRLMSAAQRPAELLGPLVGEQAGVGGARDRALRLDAHELSREGSVWCS
jgi:hypothetical protein